MNKGEIQKLSKQTQNDIMSTQIFTSYTDIVYFVVYLLHSKDVNNIVICLKLNVLVLKFSHNAKQRVLLEDNNNIEYLQNVCQVKQVFNIIEKSLMILTVFERFPVRQKIMQPKRILKQIKTLIENLSLSLSNIKFTLKQGTLQKIILHIDHMYNKIQEDSIKFKLALINKIKIEQIVLRKTEYCSIYVNQLKNAKIKRVIVSVNQRQCICPQKLMSLFKELMNKSGFLVYLEFKLPNDKYELFKRDIWLYQIETIINDIEDTLKSNNNLEQQATILITNPKQTINEDTIIIRQKPTLKRAQKFQTTRIKLLSIPPSQAQPQADESLIFNPIPSQFFISDFQKLSPKCQFYKGFILTQYKQRLFLIDQHAASQKLFYEEHLKHQIQQVELSIQLGLQYQSALKNEQNVLRKQGWKFNINNKNKQNISIKIITVPKYVCYTCNQNDFETRVILGKEVLQTKIKKLVARYACNQAYRVGDILDQKQTKTILSTLSKINTPFNCPHGRPTIIETQRPTTMMGKIRYQQQYKL